MSSSFATTVGPRPSQPTLRPLWLVRYAQPHGGFMQISAPESPPPFGWAIRRTTRRVHATPSSRLSPPRLYRNNVSDRRRGTAASIRGYKTPEQVPIPPPRTCTRIRAWRARVGVMFISIWTKLSLSLNFIWFVWQIGPNNRHVRRKLKHCWVHWMDNPWTNLRHLPNK